MTPAGGADHVAVVAGASRGLGLLISAELMARGFTVHGCARDGAGLERAGQLLAARQVGALRDASPDRNLGRFVGTVCDVGDPDQVTGWVRSVEQTHGKVDVAIHVAGIISVGPVQSTTLSHYRDAVDTMLWGPIHLSLATLPGMLERGSGRIGVVSSVGGVISVPHLLPYSIAKFGAVGLSEGLTAELSGTGVSATTVVPGLMRTGAHLHARFSGDALADYAWFAPAASLPLISISAPRAARRIVSGVLAGRAQVELTPAAWLGRRVHGLAPASTARMLGLASRVLPNATGQTGDGATVSGARARSALGSRVVNALSAIGDRAARRHNETGERRPVG